jgi:hypothetical protein
VGGGWLVQSFVCYGVIMGKVEEGRRRGRGHLGGHWDSCCGQLQSPLRCTGRVAKHFSDGQRTNGIPWETLRWECDGAGARNRQLRYLLRPTTLWRRGRRKMKRRRRSRPESASAGRGGGMVQRGVGIMSAMWDVSEGVTDAYTTVTINAPRFVW